MDSDERAHLQDLIRVYTRRFRKLELEVAKYGGNCPPHIQTELEEIQEKLDDLNRKVASGAEQPREAAYELGANVEPTTANGASAAHQSLSPSGRIACPYPGIAPFSAKDARLFYGRETEIQQMLLHLRYRRLLLVIGPSGSGKSSLLHAGLLPRLHESGYFPPDFWMVRELRPGDQPLRALAEALDDDLAEPAPALDGLLAAHAPAQRLLLLIDQFEELFTQARREDRARFIATLRSLQATRVCTLLLAIRADFYADLMITDLWPIDPSQRLEIAPLRGAPLRQALQQPAADVGVELEAGLLDRLLADAADEPGALPLIQETMTVLWAEMRGHVLPLSAYERLSGAGRAGLAAALAAKADATLDDLTSAQHLIARRIFLRLVQFGEGRADTRRQQTVVALRSADDDPALFDATLRHLADNRLLTLSRPTTDHRPPTDDHRPPTKDDQETRRHGDTETRRRRIPNPPPPTSHLPTPNGVRLLAEVGISSTIARPASVRVDLAHEALIAGWPTLQGWLATRRDAELTRRRLEAHVAEWVRLGRGSGGLLDEVEMGEVDRWLAGPEAAEVGIDPALLELVQASQAALAESVIRQLSEQARRRAADTLLHDVAQMLTSVLAPDEITTLILDQLRRVVAYNTATLVLRQGDQLRIMASRGFTEPLRSRMERGRFGLADDPNIAQIVRTRQPLALDDTLAQPHTMLAEDGVPTRGWIGAPLLLEGDVVGLLTVGSQEPGVYGDEDAQLVFALASLAAQAIRNVRLFDQVHSVAATLEQHVVERTAALAEANQLLSDEKARLQMIHAITLELAQSLDLETILPKALELVSRAIGVEHGSILLRDLATEALIRRAVLTGDGARATSEPAGFVGGQGLAGWVMQQRQTACIPDVRRDPRWLREPGRGEAVRSVAAIPLITQHTILGVLMLSSHQVNSFGAAHVQLMTTIANEIAIVIHNAELYAFITDQSLRLSELLEQQRKETGKSQAILQSVTEGVIVLDEEQRVGLVNPVAERLLNIPAEYLLQQPLAHLKTYGDAGSTARRIDLIDAALREGLQALEDGSPGYSRLLELPSPAQSIVLKFAEVIQPYGSRHGCVIVLSDITGAIEADRAKRDFVTSVSRELRDPLTSIRGYADLLLFGTAGALNGAQRALLSIVKNNANRLANLNNDIQTIGLIDSERLKQNFSFAPVAIADVLQEATQALRREIERKSLAVSIAVAERLPLVIADGWHIVQVVSRLLSNAVKYTYPGGRLALRAFLRTDDMLQIDVEDNGVGISPEQQQHLFRRFYRADNPLRGETDGTGLGLSIARSFVELHGGELWVRSEVGQGSTFSFTLPVTQPDWPASIIE
jgi:signal transduction histidine kinase